MVEESLITDEATAIIGKVTKTVPGIATVSQIKRYAQAVGDRNPLYTSEEYARKSAYGGIIAPPLFDEKCLDYGGAETEHEVLPNGSRADQQGHDVPLPKGFDESVAGGTEYTFYRPIHAGDVITTTRKVADMYEKVGRRAGKMLLIVYETTLTNQRGEVVMTIRHTIIKSKSKKTWEEKD